jgi:hypothetical protein
VSAKEISVGKGVFSSHMICVDKGNKCRQKFSRRLLPRHSKKVSAKSMLTLYLPAIVAFSDSSVVLGNVSHGVLVGCYSILLGRHHGQTA